MTEMGAEGYSQGEGPERQPFTYGDEEVDENSASFDSRTDSLDMSEEGADQQMEALREREKELSTLLGAVMNFEARVDERFPERIEQLFTVLKMGGVEVPAGAREAGKNLRSMFEAYGQQSLRDVRFQEMAKAWFEAGIREPIKTVLFYELSTTIDQIRLLTAKMEEGRDVVAAVGGGIQETRADFQSVYSA